MFGATFEDPGLAILIASVFAFFAAVCLWSSRVAMRARGRDAAMESPMLGRGEVVRRALVGPRVVKARHVRWVGFGWLAVAPIAACSILGWDNFNPIAIQRRLHSACLHVLNAEDVARRTRQHLDRQRVYDAETTCTAAYQTRVSGSFRDALTVEVDGYSGPEGLGQRCSARRADGWDVEQFDDDGQSICICNDANGATQEVNVLANGVIVQLSIDRNVFEPDAADEMIDLARHRVSEAQRYRAHAGPSVHPFFR